MRSGIGMMFEGEGSWRGWQNADPSAALRDDKGSVLRDDKRSALRDDKTNGMRGWL